MKRQTTPYSLPQYVAAGCLTLTRDGKLDLIGAGIHGETGGMPCNGCYMMKNNCPAYAMLRGADAAMPKAAPTETVREEAARRGISIGEVRRRRQSRMPT